MSGGERGPADTRTPGDGRLGAVVNLPGGGASFTVWLPSVPVPDVTAGATPKWTPPETEERAGSGTLAVDPPKGPAGI